jgi:phosphatidylglycerol:prolipoprotein diacylglycerol transferase
VLPSLELAGWRVGTHELFTLVGLAVGLGIYYAELRRRGMLEPTVVWVSLAVLVGGAVGARLVLAWEHLDELRALEGLPWLTAIERSGKSLLGAIAGGYLAGLAAKRALGYRVSTGDCYALALPVAVAIGRIGCFLSELPLGAPTDLPWGVRVSPDAAARFTDCPGCAGPMHPVMLYEIAFDVLAAALVVRLAHRVPVRGDLLKCYLVAALCFRFVTEWIRVEDTETLGLTGPQLVLLPMLALLALHFGREWRTGAWHVPSPEPWPPAGSKDGRPAEGGDHDGGTARPVGGRGRGLVPATEPAQLHRDIAPGEAA